MMDPESACVLEILRTPIIGTPPIASRWMGHPRMIYKIDRMNPIRSVVGTFTKPATFVHTPWSSAPPPPKEVGHPTSLRDGWGTPAGFTRLTG